jgi:tRNA (guanine-N(7)-)-methyltransferase subunit TRM82
MAHPYQIARVCKAPQFGESGLLLAACGPKIVSVNLEDGSVLSQWPVESESSMVRSVEEGIRSGMRIDLLAPGRQWLK